MKKIFKKIGGWLFWIVLLGALAYYFRSYLLDFKNRFYQQYLPCQKPITYRINTFDTHFGIKQKDFLAVIAQAEQTWEKPTGLNLFEYSPSGTLKINLIYDYRQDATVKLRQLGIIVKDDQATYDKLQTQYAAAEKTYQSDKTTLENQISILDTRTAAYNAEVNNWNRKGGAPLTEIERIKTEEIALNQLANQIKIQQDAFNSKVDEINALADTLNRLAKTLNLSAARYNTVGASRGSEFEEGTYISSAAGEEIDIYQFDNTQKLVRVLAHELGHALGLGHVSSTKAIMYYLNNGVNEKLAPADLQEIKQHCDIK